MYKELKGSGMMRFQVSALPPGAEATSLIEKETLPLGSFL
jgi:hypothetical protein